MILIASAAYVNAEFQTEFGRLPPAMLPVGNRRLFERQIDTLQAHFPGEPVFLSLPASYVLAPKDDVLLQRRQVRVLHNDVGLSLGDSIAAAVAKAGGTGRLRLLHGDTWIRDLPADGDVIGIVQTRDDYAWEVEADVGTAEAVWCGYFAFEDAAAFLQALQRSNSFTAAVRQYDGARPLRRAALDHWLDFGHVNTYFHSRAGLTTERAFNTLQISDGCVRKSGTPAVKIDAERRWFEGLPTSLRVFAPQLIDHGNVDGQAFYVLEYLPLPPLNELFVHGRNPVFHWDKVFALCADFLRRCSEQPLPPPRRAAVGEDARRLVEDKTWERLSRYIAEAGHPGLDVPNRLNGLRLPPLREIVEDCLRRHAGTHPVPGVMHGDFCLSNILFDSRADRIKVIDPRGLDAGGGFAMHGDLRYDLAKLTHSVLGLYDHIVAGACDARQDWQPDVANLELTVYIDERVQAIQAAFAARRFLPDTTPLQVLPLTILLFLSMLPLHADNPQRQTALLANALRLYADLIAREGQSHDRDPDARPEQPLLSGGLHDAQVSVAPGR